MTKIGFITGVIVLLLLLLVSHSMADIKTITITSDTRPLILFEKFGFTSTGHVAIAASSVSITTPWSKPNPSQLGFFLLSEESTPKIIIEIEQNHSFCVLDSLYITRLFTLDDLSLPSPTPTMFNRTYPVTSPSLYSFFFANCATQSSVSITIHTEFFNFDNDVSRNYLSSDQTHLPSLFFVIFITYLVFLVVWLYLCHVSNHSLCRIHLLMALFLLTKAVSVFCAARDKLNIKTTGTSHSWDVFFFVFDFIRVVLFFTVVILVGTRWTFLHSFVRERGNKVLFIVIPLQVLANVALVVIHNNGPYIKDWVTWNQVFMLLDFYSCFAVLLLIVWAVRSLRESKKDPIKLNKFSLSLSLIWRFYMIVIGYVFLTRFGLLVLNNVVVYEYRWVSNDVVQETATLVFCIFMFYVFRLFEKDEFSVIGHDGAEEEQVAKIAVKGLLIYKNKN